MQLKQVKAFMNKVVYYDTGQMNIEGCSIQEFILTACVLRHDKKSGFYYQAPLYSAHGGVFNNQLIGGQK